MNILKNKTLLIAAAAILALLIAGIIIVPAAAQRTEIRSQLTLGERYLAEFDYESAILAYGKVLEIDPKNVEAYLGLARAQIALGDRAGAADTLSRGFALTGDARLKDFAASQNLVLADAGHPGDTAPNPGKVNGLPEREILGAEWLEEKIAAWFGKKPSELTQADYDSITHLAFDPEHVIINHRTSLNGESSYNLGGGVAKGLAPDTSAFASVIARCPNLTALICYMEAETYSYLAEILTLSGLRELTVYSNTEEDLSWLEAFPGLQNLSLHLNDTVFSDPKKDIIVSTDWLKAFSGLRTFSVHASVHLIQMDLSGLAGVPALHSLNVSANVLDFSPLGTLTQMENLILHKHPGGGKSASFDIGVTAGMPGLRQLNISGYPLSDLSVLTSLENLTDLMLNNNGIADLSPLASLEKLSWVWIENNPVTDWSPLDHVENVSGRPDDWVRK